MAFAAGDSFGMVERVLHDAAALPAHGLVGVGQGCAGQAVFDRGDQCFAVHKLDGAPRPRNPSMPG